MIQTMTNSSKKKINSRQKGASGERELAHLLTQSGFPSRRGQQFSGSPESPDVVCESLAQFHIECKRTQKTDIYGWLEQTRTDKKDNQIPLICHRKNHQEWVAILPLTDLLELLKNG